MFENYIEYVLNTLSMQEFPNKELILDEFKRFLKIGDTHEVQCEMKSIHNILFRKHNIKFVDFRRYVNCIETNWSIDFEDDI